MSNDAEGWAWQNSPYRGSQLLVHLALGDIANDAHDYELWLSTASIAKKARCSRNTVTTVLSDLVRRGLLELIEAGGSQRKPSRYRFLMPSALTAPVEASSQSASTRADRASTSALTDVTSAISSTALARSPRTELKEEITQVTQEELKPDIAVFEAWKRATGKNGRTFLDAKRKRAIREALRVYPLEDVIDAVRGWDKSPFHAGQNDQRKVYNELHLLLRDNAQIEMFRDLERGQRQAPMAADPVMAQIQRQRELEGRA